VRNRKYKRIDCEVGDRININRNNHILGKKKFGQSKPTQRKSMLLCKTEYNNIQVEIYHTKTFHEKR
jgi:hypothetical protein